MTEPNISWEAVECATRYYDDEGRHMEVANNVGDVVTAEYAKMCRDTADMLRALFAEGERLRAECQRLAGEVSRAHRDALAWMERAAVARREGIEVAAAVASKRAASRHSTVAHCHSDRSKKHMQIRADEAGQLVADIRALLEDGR